MAYIPNPLIEEGGENKVNTTNSVGNDLLKALLREIKLLKLHIASLTEETFTAEDIEEE